MGRAFTEQERTQVHERLRRVGLRLFREQGVRNVSIRELTKEVGIAQGGFYTFYKDKEEFLLDLVLLRIREKLQIVIDNRSETLSDPVGYMIEWMYREGMHLKENRAFNNAISGTLEFFSSSDLKTRQMTEQPYRECLRLLAGYWQEEGYEVRMNEDGIMASVRSACILFSNADLIGERFAEVFRTFCEAEVNRFLSVVKKDG